MTSAINPDNDIMRLANSLVAAHGETAPIEAALRAQARLDQGDGAGCTLWRRIGGMCNVLLSHAAAAAAGVR